MRRALILLALWMSPVAVWAQTQTFPKVEVYGGYSYLDANFSKTSVTLNGAAFSVAENLNSWFGGTLDISSHFGTEAGHKTNMETASYGPVFSYRKNKAIVPFGEAMLGVVRGAANYLNISKPETRFAVYTGGGVDVRVNDRLAVRVIQADYLMTRFSSARQDNVRLSAGVVLRLGLGKKK